jgi:hypothetical protein
MAEKALQPRRGPKPNPNRGTPSGYRLTDRTRFELQTAALFVGTDSLQDTIALAVDEFVSRMREVEGFTEAMRSAERHQQARAGVPTMTARQSRPDADASQPM